MTNEQRIQENISTETGIQLSRVLLANRSIFEFIKKEMESGNRKPVRVPKWGTFGCKPERVRKLGLENNEK